MRHSSALLSGTLEATCDGGFMMMMCVSSRCLDGVYCTTKPVPWPRTCGSMALQLLEHAVSVLAEAHSSHRCFVVKVMALVCQTRRYCCQSYCCQSCCRHRCCRHRCCRHRCCRHHLCHHWYHHLCHHHCRCCQRRLDHRPRCWMLTPVSTVEESAVGFAFAVHRFVSLF